MNDALISRRLFSQQLVSSSVDSPGALVAWLGAVQAQDYAGSKWALGLRLPGSTDADIETALRRHEIIRTWTLRGTLHYVAPADIRWMLDLVAARVIAGRASRYRQLELDADTIAKSSDLIANAVRDGQQATRSELAALLQRGGIDTSQQRGIHLISYATLQGIICQSVTVRNDATFVALETAAPQAKTLPRADAVAELARRYFTSHGPATLADFAWWSGLPLKEARPGLEANQPHLAQETIAGQQYWFSAEAAAASAEAPEALLLSQFDEYFIAYKDRSAVLDSQERWKLDLGNGLTPVIALRGRILGAWTRSREKDKVVIHARPFYSFTDADRQAIEAVAQRYGEFLGMPVALA